MTEGTATIDPVLFDRATGEARSPRWATVRAAWLADHPACAACGGTELLAVHHKRPFHRFPHLELEDTNFITLCEAPARHCHYCFGHAYNWHGWVSTVVEDAADFRHRVEESNRLAKI